MAAVCVSLSSGTHAFRRKQIVSRRQPFWKWSPRSCSHYSPGVQGAEPDLFAYSWLAAASLPLAAIDWTTRQLPTKLIWPTCIILAALLGMVP